LSVSLTGSGPPDVLDGLHTGVLRRRANWVIDADIPNLFDAMLDL
jgi:hypothetical protein